MNAFNQTQFIMGAQASFRYPDSRTGELRTRNGIVEQVAPTFVRVSHVNPETQAVEYRTYQYTKMQA